jgi:hypothetical protein
MAIKLSIVRGSFFFNKQTKRPIPTKSPGFLLNRDDLGTFLPLISGVTQSDFPSILIKFLSH